MPMATTTTRQQRDTASTTNNVAAAVEREVNGCGGDGDEDEDMGAGTEGGGVQLPSPVASSDVLYPGRVDSALSWRLSTEAELRRQSRARLRRSSSVGVLEGILDEETRRSCR